MARRVVSVLRLGPGALRPTDPALEANAYAVAEDVDLTVVLRGSAVEFALSRSRSDPGELAGIALPPATGSQDLRGLLESGVRVVAEHEALERRGIRPDELVDGVGAIGTDDLAQLLADAQGVLTW